MQCPFAIGQRKMKANYERFCIGKTLSINHIENPKSRKKWGHNSMCFENRIVVWKSHKWDLVNKINAGIHDQKLIIVIHLLLDCCENFQ